MRIVNHEEYEKNQKFTIELGEPRPIIGDKPSAYTSSPSVNCVCVFVCNSHVISQVDFHLRYCFTVRRLSVQCFDTAG